MSVRDVRSIPDVVRDILANLQEIVRSEFRLAKIEIREEVSKAAQASTSLGAGLMLTFYAIGFLLLAGVYALSIVVATWLAALIVGIAVGVLALILVQQGKKKLASVRPPAETIDSVKENVQWAKNQAR
jgi:uncharacterized membrane protein YqjE